MDTDSDSIHFNFKAIDKSCRDFLPSRAIEGLLLFNQRNYFEAHEALEDAWRAETGQIRNLYRAILQIGLGYYQIQRQNYTGAVKMFRRCKRWLEPFPDRCRGVDLADLRKNLTAVETEMLRLGKERIHEFPTRLIKPVLFDSRSSKSI